MARTQRDVVSYFPHDADSSGGDTLTVLQSRFGNNGYAFWFKLLEKLASTDGHYLDVSNPIKWQLFIAKMGVDEITSVEIMKLLVEMEAIDKDLWELKLIWCQKLVDNVADVYKNRRREIPQKPLTTDLNSLTTDNKSLTTGGSTQRKGDKIKVDNIYIYIFEHWNKQEIISHKNLTANMKKAIDNALKDYSQEEIKQAMQNYALIVNGAKYYFNHKWTMIEFLSRRKADELSQRERRSRWNTSERYCGENHR